MFVLASTALALAPGPDNIFVLTQSALYGRVAGWWVTLGLCTGLLFHTTLAAVGAAAILASSALAFTVLKILGAGYLLYLAWGACRALPVNADAQALAAPSARALYTRGVVMNLTNPKVAVFFLAFLPQFVSSQDSVGAGFMAAQMLLLGACFIAVTGVVFGGVVWGASFIGDWLKRSPRGQLMINRFAAVVFVGLAWRLLIAERY